MTIRLFDLPAVGGFTLDYVDNRINGMSVRSLEDLWSERMDWKYSIATASCTVAITIVLEWIKREYGDPGYRYNVHVPSMIPPVVPNAVYQAIGSQFEWSDNIDWVGDSYCLVSSEEFRVIDSAHRVAKEKSRELTDIVLYSFYPTKPCGGIDGGMICTNNENLANWARLAVNNGVMGKGVSWNRSVAFPGWKAYMSTIQAMYVRRVVEQLDRNMLIVDGIREAYNSAFGLENRSQHLYRLTDVEDQLEFMERMKRADIETGIHYKALAGEFVWGNVNTECRKSIHASRHCVSIPMHSGMCSSDVDRVISEVKKCRR